MRLRQIVPESAIRLHKILPRLLREQKRQMEEVLLKRGEVVGLDRDGGDDDRDDYGMRFTLMIPVNNRSSTS